MPTLVVRDRTKGCSEVNGGHVNVNRPRRPCPAGLRPSEGLGRRGRSSGRSFRRRGSDGRSSPCRVQCPRVSAMDSSVARPPAARSTSMKNTTNRMTTNARSRQVTRREFVGGALAAGVVAGAPAILRGRNLNDKLNIAFIACGGRANASLSELTITPGRGGRGGRRASGSASRRERGRALRREPARGGRSGSAVPESQDVQRSPARLRPARTTSTPSSSPPPSTPMRSRPTWR